MSMLTVQAVIYDYATFTILGCKLAGVGEH